MATADPLRARALACLRESRVVVRHAEILGGAGSNASPTVVIATVRSSREGQRPYRVDLLNDRWTCTCTVTPCPHLLAVKMCTGWARGAA